MVDIIKRRLNNCNSYDVTFDGRCYYTKLSEKRIHKGKFRNSGSEEQKIEVNRWRWYSHIKRTDEDHITKKVRQLKVVEVIISGRAKDT